MASPLELLMSCLLLVAIFLPLASTSSLQPPKSKGFTRPLFPPTSPRSPFYNQILKANNITATANNTITLNRTHYRKWLKSSLRPKGEGRFQSKESEITNQKIVGWVMDMYVGNPLQYVVGTFDTGSDLVWFGCEDPSQTGTLTKFKQSESSSFRQVLCGDDIRCDTTSDDIKCTDYEKPCWFSIRYADQDSATGFIATDEATLSTPDDHFPELKFGCSTSNSNNVAGIIGAGNADYSIHKQLNQDDPQFSYCISSDVDKTSLVKFGSDAMLLGKSTTVLQNNNTVLYYLNVLAIQVNGVNIDVAPSAFAMSKDGSKGFFIDSGTSITSFPKVVFNALQKMMTGLLGPPKSHSIFDICYPPSRFTRRRVRRPSIAILFPEFTFVLPETGTWEVQDDANLECLLIEKDNYNDYSTLGYEQLFDVNVGHDVKNNRLYLERITCPSSVDA